MEDTLTKWQPIKTAPRDGREIWLLTPRGVSIGEYGTYGDRITSEEELNGVWFAKSEGDRVFDDRERYQTVENPTHWMEVIPFEEMPLITVPR